MTFVAGVLRHAGDASELRSRMLHRSGREPGSWRLLESSPNVAFGISLSSILPEDSFDRQPLSDDRYILVGDIRIDNRAELSSKLGLPAAHSREMADSDLFFSAWLRWQKDVVLHVIGGFAVAIWDKHKRELCLIRDHCGEIPIYYIGDAATFAFASSPRALRGMPGIDTSLNEEHLLHYLAIGPDSAAATYFKNILLLRPGHLLTVCDGTIACRRYWHPSNAPAIRLRSNEEYVEALLERFDAAVQARLRTNGKIGSQLSGGMDSSSVTATAAQLLGTTRLTAFTAVPQPAFRDLNPTGRFGNEGPAAALVAARYPNIDHVLIEPSSQDMIRVVEEMGRASDTPVFNPMNQMWINAILDEARNRNINVVLQGACGNGTISFGGLIGLSDLLRSGRWISLLAQVRTLRAKGHTSWRGAANWAAGSFLPLSLRKFLSADIRNYDFSLSPVHPDRAREHNLRKRAIEEYFGTQGNSEVFRRLGGRSACVILCRTNGSLNSV
jgi:asparagine synthase (glutamine-hydrolysing)